MTTIPEPVLENLVAEASAEILDNAKHHVARWAADRKNPPRVRLSGDHAQSGGFGPDMVSEIATLVEQCWSFAQTYLANHRSTIIDNATATIIINGLSTALRNLIHGFKQDGGRGAPPRPSLTEEEKDAIASKLVARIVELLRPRYD